MSGKSLVSLNKQIEDREEGRVEMGIGLFFAFFCFFRFFSKGTVDIISVDSQFNEYCMSNSQRIHFKGCNRLRKVVELRMQCCGKLLSNSIETY